ncbi:MAG: hypothetical protein HOC71_11840 [Candidatus Latescibacteria bacterium]|jgi:hypothetical protein|nr:hypothetical protein [Candidatus Latescibacterota bacterium]
MAIQDFENLEELGDKIANFYKIALEFEKSGYDVEKRDKDSSNNYGFIVIKKDEDIDSYFRINFIYNFISDKSNVFFERGTLSDGKPYMKESIRDVSNMYLTLSKCTDSVSKNMITFLYTHGDRFSIVNVETDMNLSRVCAFDKRKFLQGKEVPKEILDKRREFKKVT